MLFGVLLGIALTLSVQEVVRRTRTHPEMREPEPEEPAINEPPVMPAPPQPVVMREVVVLPHELFVTPHGECFHTVANCRGLRLAGEVKMKRQCSYEECCNA
jgi:hypothetical protein